jgi:hypothetical protein
MQGQKNEKYDPCSIILDSPRVKIDKNLEVTYARKRDTALRKKPIH